ncbi:PadR family transcriptional regulator [Sulfuracidifex metallicus]|uniref:PadR family transcriptional regulator n=1 Tax=Sulfuracidifex metallicus DSM 6482 = JCM 9184 TaxID=523847 RepID=A0A6A9QM74_SULME|nr:PadR family transcriptional regulator [Sulfuracidifex metallicus]MUN28808.1 PadR family transcriptional regulator [Sulfuracidifex metallicus DSM 6482 = JCM 9184]WOE50677.1 PadR family transcriptional regulator [Sulfuracidifex metallicus DSM 6482 = JCM 9184]
MSWFQRKGLKNVILNVLKGRSMTGSQIIDEIERITLGMWRPSPGSIYPALDQLEEDGLVRISKVDGWKKYYELTEKGKQELEKIENGGISDVVSQMEFVSRYLIENYERMDEKQKRKIVELLEELKKYFYT